MAPTPSPTLGYSSNSSAGKHLHHLRHQALAFAHHPLGHSSVSRTEQFKPRTLDPALRPSLVLEGPTPSPFAPAPSQSDVLTSEPSTAPAGDSSPSQSGDVPGNIVVVVVVMVLILGGLIGLTIGGEVLRREAKATGKGASSAPLKCARRRKPKSIKNAAPRAPQSTRIDNGKFPYDEKTLTPLTRPPPVLNRERQSKLSNVWPLRSLSRALHNRRSSEQGPGGRQQPPAPVLSPQTTWSEFSPVLLYAASPRTPLPRIPEEHEEDYQSQSHGDFGVDALHRLLEYNPGVSSPQTMHESVHDMFPKGSNEPGSLATTERQEFSRVAKDEDAKSLDSLVPDMTADGGESSRSSTISLESLEDGKGDGKEEVFELRRAQTRSMQMNKGVLLSLSTKTLPGNGMTDGELGRDSSRAASTVGDVAGCQDCGDVGELSLGMLGGSFSAVNLDEFPSPPSVLPMIPSFVSGF